MTGRWCEVPGFPPGQVKAVRQVVLLSGSLRLPLPAGGGGGRAGGGADARAPARPASSAPAPQAPGLSPPPSRPRPLYSGSSPPARWPTTSVAATPSNNPKPARGPDRQSTAPNRRRGAASPPGSLPKKRPSPWRRGAFWQRLSRGGAVVGSFPGPSRGSRDSAALTANSSRARNASARSSPQSSRTVRRAAAHFEGARRLAMSRGGATVCPGSSDTSVSGAAATILRGSPRPPGETSCESQNAEVLRYRSLSLCCSPSRSAMLEHLSSLPTQMVRVLPEDPRTLR